jgi:SAM-dependent methyltransferase
MILPEFTTNDFPLIFDTYHLKYYAGKYNKGLDHYESELGRIGLIGRGANSGRVLDCACGGGQWSLAFAPHVKEVVGVDISCERLLIAERVRSLNAVHNVRFLAMSGDDLHFPRDHFDTVFCYSAVWMMNERKALAEFARVLKSGGRLYLSCNGLGWFLDRIRMGLQGRGWKVALDHMRSIARTPLCRVSACGCERTTFLSRGYMTDLLLENGFTDLKVIEGEDKISFRRDEYYGFPGVFEIAAAHS